MPGSLLNSIMTIGSIYSGAIDAFAYAAQIVGMQCLWQIEIDKRSHVYLRKNYPDTKKFYTDEFTDQYKLQFADIICGGDPCQPHSNAGNREGENDHRFRWPFMFNTIKTYRPHWVINENVIGSISNLVLDQKITDLESIGYTCRAYIIPAVGTNACHERKRVFLIANSYGIGRRELLHDNYGSIFEAGSHGKQYALDTQGDVFLQFEKSCSEPALLPVDDGISDHVFRLEAAGNSIVSTIPIIFLTAIQEADKIYQQQK